MSLFKEKSPEIIHLPTRDPAIIANMKSQFNGIAVPTFVHAHYCEDINYEVKPKQVDYRDERNKTIAACLQDHGAVLMLEELTNLDQLPQRLKGLGKGVVYVWPTPFANPTPLTANLIEYLSHRRDFAVWTPSVWEDTQCWQGMAKYLHQLNVTSFAVGGEWLLFYTQEETAGTPLGATAHQLTKPGSGQVSWKDKKIDSSLIPGFCTGTFALEMAAKGFPVSLSLPRWPNDVYRNFYLYKNH